VVDKPVSKPVLAKAPKAVAANAAPVGAKVTPIAKLVVAAKPVAVAPPVVAKTETSTVPAVAAAATAPLTQGNTLMNDTINKTQEAAKNFAEQASERTQAMFGDMNGRAKDAMAKGTKAIEELVEFSKGNLEAMVASGKVAATGAQDIAKYTADYGRKSIEEATATAKKFAGVKSPTEFFQLQSEVAKSSLDAMVAEGSKFTESYLKLLGDIAQPIQNRVSVAVEKVKTSVAA
jgi:phasin family protein